MRLSNFGAVRLPLLAAAVLALFACPVSAQIVERSQTWDNLIATHPCNAGLNGRHTILTDAQSSSSIGGGGGSVRVFVECDGVDTWSIVSIGGGASGPADALAPAVVIEGTTADAFEGNFTFADPTADWTLAFSATGAAKFPDGLSSAPSITLSNTAVGFYKDADIGANFIGFSASTPSFRFGQATIEFVGNGYIAWGNQTNTFAGSGVDTIIQRGAAGIVRIQDALRLTPVASPPAACAAGTEGAIYSDDSHALCWCDASAWQKISGAGTCA